LYSWKLLCACIESMWSFNFFPPAAGQWRFLFFLPRTRLIDTTTIPEWNWYLSHSRIVLFWKICSRRSAKVPDQTKRLKYFYLRCVSFDVYNCKTHILDMFSSCILLYSNRSCTRLVVAQDYCTFERTTIESDLKIIF